MKLIQLMKRWVPLFMVRWLASALALALFSMSGLGISSLFFIFPITFGIYLLIVAMQLKVKRQLRFFAVLAIILRKGKYQFVFGLLCGFVIPYALERLGLRTLFLGFSVIKVAALTALVTVMAREIKQLSLKGSSFSNVVYAAACIAGLYGLVALLTADPILVLSLLALDRLALPFYPLLDQIVVTLFKKKGETKDPPFRKPEEVDQEKIEQLMASSMRNNKDVVKTIRQTTHDLKKDPSVIINAPSFQ